MKWEREIVLILLKSSGRKKLIFFSSFDRPKEERITDWT